MKIVRLRDRKSWDAIERIEGYVQALREVIMLAYATTYYKDPA